jgi:large subunit ribosomal protein L31e
MSQEVERVYTIPLGKVLLSQSQHRAVRAINMIKEFARHHMKVEDIKIEEDLAHQIWSKGVRSPPRKVRVRMSKTDEGYVLVSPYEEEIESKVTPEKETPKVEDKVEEPTKEENKVEAEVEEPEAENKVEAEVEKQTKEESTSKEESTAKEEPKVEDKVEEPAKETPSEEPKKEEKE